MDPKRIQKKGNEVETFILGRQIFFFIFSGTRFFFLTAVSGVGSSPALATCETSQFLLAGVPGDFSRGSPVLVQPTD